MSSEYEAHLSLVPLDDGQNKRSNFMLRDKLDDIVKLMGVGLGIKEAKQMMLDIMAPAPVINRLTRGF